MQKIILSFTFLLFFVSHAYTQGDGIEFSTAKWKEILQLAKDSDKLIFMDAYTTWCGPCKMMTRDIFPQKTVGDFYNKNFINVKMDMEKGEGKMLSEKYNVVAYPTLLFIAADGTLVHRVAGYHDESQFLELGETAIDPSKNLAAMKQRYQSGERDPVFLKKYTSLCFDVMDGSHTAVAEEYMASQKDWSSEENMEFIQKYTNSADSPMFTFLTENRTAFIDQFGEKNVVRKIQELVYQKIYNTPDINLDQIKDLYKKAYPEKAEQLSSHYRMQFYRNRGDRDSFASSAIDHYAKYPTKDAMELNDVAWTFYEAIDKPEYLNGAVKLAKKSIKLDKGYMNTDTLAALYKKLGKKGKALKTAKKAIKLAKKSNEDYSLTEDLIKEIELL